MKNLLLIIILILSVSTIGCHAGKSIKDGPYKYID